MSSQHVNDFWSLPSSTVHFGKFQLNCVAYWDWADHLLPSFRVTVLLLFVIYLIFCVCVLECVLVSQCQGLCQPNICFLCCWAICRGRVGSEGSEMELRSRRLCHIPHVAFIIESVHACLHGERPESAALSMPSGKLAFILTLEHLGLEPSGCCRPNENLPTQEGFSTLLKNKILL